MPSTHTPSPAAPELRAALSPIVDVIAELTAGRMVIMADDATPDSAGILLQVAQCTQGDDINFMAHRGRGLVSLTLTRARCELLKLVPMAASRRPSRGATFMTSIEAAEGVTTGISSDERAITIHVAVNPGARADDLVQPGHMFPLRAEEGGVLAHAGHAEAGCDLARLAGMEPAAVVCQVLDDAGELARLPHLLSLAAQHTLKIGSIADLIHFRASTETLVARVDERDISTPYGAFRLLSYHDRTADTLHYVLLHGEVQAEQETLVRVHEPFTELDLLDQRDFGHAWGLPAALQTLAAAPCGVIILLRRPLSTDDLLRQLKSAHSEPQASPKYDLLKYGIGAQILADLGVGKVRLMAQPRRMPSMAGFDLDVTGFLLPDGPRERIGTIPV